ncbi:MAG: TldD/PmbA family protein, partial [Actinomycetota bacterium]|nr:TldD/PmbA family protein [Actinomycetota bacterium]
MLDDAVIKKVLAEALSRGGDLAEIFVEDRRSTSLKLEDSRIEDVNSGRDQGAGVRILSGERASYAYTNLLTTNALMDAARAARAGLSGSPTEVADLRRVRAPVEHPVEIPPSDIGAQEKASSLQAADDAARSEGGEVRQVVATYLDLRQRVLIASSDGRRAEDDRTRVRLGVRVVAARDSEIATGFDGPGHSGGYELLHRQDPADVG